MDEPVEEPAEESSDAGIDLTGWSCYAGMMEDETGVYYAFNETGDRGAFVALSPDNTQSISLIGDYVFDDAEGIGYITDDTTGASLAFIATVYDDSSIEVDLGDLGTASIGEVDAETIIACMDIIQAGTTDVTAEWLASLGF